MKLKEFELLAVDNSSQRHRAAYERHKSKRPVEDEKNGLTTATTKKAFYDEVFNSDQTGGSDQSNSDSLGVLNSDQACDFVRVRDSLRHVPHDFSKD